MQRQQYEIRISLHSIQIDENNICGGEMMTKRRKKLFDN